MFESFTEAQWVGFSFVLLGMALIFGMLVRRVVPWLAAVYVPASVIAGFLILLAGPQVLGEVTNGWSLIPAHTIPVLSALPGLLINIVFGGIMIGKTLPSMRRIWNGAAPHAILGGVFSFGQFAIGGLVVTLLLTPVFGLPDAAGSIIEMSFAGGHGTIGGMGGLFDNAGAGELVDIGLGLATISMLTGVIGGTMLINWAVRRPATLPAITRRPGPPRVDSARCRPTKATRPTTSGSGRSAAASAPSRSPSSLACCFSPACGRSPRLSDLISSTDSHCSHSP